MQGTLVHQYRILGQLGAGGMGIVYEAEDTKLGRKVALKFLPESLHLSADASDRFEREARLAGSLTHPNICTVHDSGIFEGRRFFVMELLEGPDHAFHEGDVVEYLSSADPIRIRVGLRQCFCAFFDQVFYKIPSARVPEAIVQHFVPDQCVFIGSHAEWLMVTVLDKFMKFRCFGLSE